MGNTANRWLLAVLTSTALIFGLGQVKDVGYEGLKTYEGTKTLPYKDVANILTVCTGHTGSDVVKGKLYTQAECDVLLKKDLEDKGKKILKYVKVPLNQNQFMAFESFVFNVGEGSFAKSAALRKLNKGDYTGACRALAYHDNGSPAWSYANGKYSKGLHKRRVAEMKLCLAQPIK